jgi:hypothetical protein
LGWAIITHPFHPRRGERFRVLKARRYGGQMTLILEREEGGHFSILEEWSDKATPTGTNAACLFSLPALLELVELVRQLKGSEGPAEPGLGNQKGVDRCA